MKNITLYGAQHCHKTQFYMQWLKNQNLDFDFRDVEKNEDYAQELRNLYESGKLNFPTFLIKGKKLRNPTLPELTKWLIKKELTEINQDPT